MDLRSGCAYWVARDGLLAAYPRLRQDERADIAVIGAGVTGAATAYRLTQTGANVVVLDRRDVASGSTAASTGLLLYEIDTPLSKLATFVGLDAAKRAYQLGGEAIVRIRQLCEEIGDDCGFAWRPCLYLASSKRDVKALDEEHQLRTSIGLGVTRLHSDALQHHFGIAAPAALLSAGQAEIDTYRFTHALLAGARKRGARIFDRTDVLSVTRRTAGFELRTDDGCCVHARRVVYATGYEAVETLNRKVTALHSTWACATEPVDVMGPWAGCLIWETARPYLYLRTSDRRVLVGGEDSRFSKRHDNARVRQKKTVALMRRLHRLIPELEAEPAYSWAGVFGDTRDGLPFIGPVDDPDIWYALGFGGNGITFGIIAADILADAWTGTTNHDARLFAFDREWRLQQCRSR